MCCGQSLRQETTVPQRVQAEEAETNRRLEATEEEGLDGFDKFP